MGTYLCSLLTRFLLQTDIREKLEIMNIFQRISWMVKKNTTICLSRQNHAYANQYLILPPLVFTRFF